jgi:two-component system heavy metal sensor histidine kinase CusS
MLGAVMALTLLTLGGAFTAIAFSVNRAQERQLDQALLAEAREEAAEIASVGGRRLTISDRPGPAANDVGPLTKYGAIYSDDGAVIAATPTWRSPPRAAALPAEAATPSSETKAEPSP